MLMQNQLMGFWGRCLPPSSIAYQSDSATNTDSASYTFNMSLGPADLPRIVSIYGSAGATRTITSVTVDGVSAVEIGKADSGGTTVALWLAMGSANTTGDVVVNTDSAWLRCVVGVYSVSNLVNRVPYDTKSDVTASSNVLSVSIDVPPNGFVVGVVGQNTANLRTWAWSGITEDYDTAVEATRSSSGASDEFTAPQTGLSVTATSSGATSEQALFVASFR